MITGVRLDAEWHELRMVGLPTIRGHSNSPTMFVPNRGRALKPCDLSFGRRHFTPPQRDWRTRNFDILRTGGSSRPRIRKPAPRQN